MADATRQEGPQLIVDHSGFRSSRSRCFVVGATRLRRRYNREQCSSNPTYSIGPLYNFGEEHVRVASGGSSLEPFNGGGASGFFLGRCEL